MEREKAERKRREERANTKLRPHHLGHGTDELGRGCRVQETCFFVYEFADAEPEGSFEFLLASR